MSGLRWSPEELKAFVQRAQAAQQAVQQVLPPPAPPKKRSKYGNRVFEADGVRWDSRKEYRRYQLLLLRQQAGEIAHLARQVPFQLVVNDALICTYIADFVYLDKATGRQVVEDAKSKATRTPAYRLKVKLMAALRGIEVIEV